ncbi:MAG: ParB N-terminal domain-containing protein [Acaryochloridaceae cyanobacterium RU_4_10]|nr:ParB N-terminal domain-containing protein [Acaryochloridaceae cyanobacterium RU_4_10]
MTRKRATLNLDRLNERASAEFVPTVSISEQSVNQKLLPLGSIYDRPQGDARPLNQNHISALADSIMVLGLISPLTVDRNGQLLAGGHRRAALLQISLEQTDRFEELFPDGIPVRVMDIDASIDGIDALQIEVEENTQRRNFTPAEIREAALRLESAGYEKLRGRPRPGQKSLKRELANVFRLSEDRIQRILNDSEQKGRRTPTFSAEGIISTLERWIKDLGAADSPQQLKVRKQMQQLIKEIGKLN